MKEYKVGQTIVVKLSDARIVEETITAIRQTTHSARLQVLFGSETALIYEWQIVEPK